MPQYKINQVLNEINQKILNLEENVSVLNQKRYDLLSQFMKLNNEALCLKSIDSLIRLLN